MSKRATRWAAPLAVGATLALQALAPAPAAAQPLPFYYDLYTFRGDDGDTEVVATIAVPVRRLRRERVDGRFQYRFDVRFVIADTAKRSVSERVDSVFAGVSRPLSSRHLLHTHVEVRAPPSRTTVQRLVVTDATRPGVGQLYRGPFEVPDYSGDELMLSDVAFGLPGATAGWTRRAVTLALLPTSQFPVSAFDVYYEIYNLPAGTPYETEVAIQPLDGDDEEDGAVRTVFREVSAAGPDRTVGELRRIESALAPGPYRVIVTVRDQRTGRTASRLRDIEVRQAVEGTTLVRAWPRGDRVQ